MNGLEGYRPTRIRRLYVRGYRSIRELELVDLPPIVIFHGENGSGKSNILRAMALPLRWLGSELPIAGKREEAARIDYLYADAQLGIRRDDFYKQSPFEMQISLAIELGSRATSAVGELPLGVIFEIDVVVQDVGDGIRWWMPKAQIGDQTSLIGNTPRDLPEARRIVKDLTETQKQIEADLKALEKQFNSSIMNDDQRYHLNVLINIRGGDLAHQQKLVHDAEQHLVGKLATLDRIRSVLLRNYLISTSDAYRRVVREPIGKDSEFDLDPNELSSPEQIQKRLYLLGTSPNPKERAVLRKLATRLGEISPMFNHKGAPPELAAVRNNEFREYETQITRSNGESIPLSYLGTGEQQLLILLLDVLVSRAAIVQIEEPEAHLHKKFMLRLARVLEQVVQDHDVDQLFIATHHHAFAIASQYYDISYDQEHGTRAVLNDRAKAIQHFYEPSPLWDALRSLVSAGLSENAVLFRDENGRPVHAQEVLASIREEGPLAKQFAEEMTKTILLSMREDAEFGEP